MKRTFAILISMAMLLAVLSGCKSDAPLQTDSSVESTVSSTAPEPPANPASDFEYGIDQDENKAFIKKYIGTSKDVVIPAEIDGMPVTVLSYTIEKGTNEYIGPFQDSDIRSVYIPATIKAFYLNTFKNCTALEQVVFAEQSELLYISGFENCTALKRIDLSNTKVKEIDPLAFSGCSALEEVIFSDYLQVIHEKAFLGCSALKEVNLPDSMLGIKGHAFGDCASIKRIYIPAKLDISVSDASIFYGMTDLEQIVFADGCEKIDGLGVFRIHSDTEITVPASVNYFEPLTFFVYGEDTDITIRFHGDCPEIAGEYEHYADSFGKPTVLYAPDTEGWGGCVWNGKYTVEPIISQ